MPTNPNVFPPPPLDTPSTGKDGRHSSPWARWLQLLAALVKNMVDLDSVQTLTNKTLTAPVVSDITDSTRCYAVYGQALTQAIADNTPSVINFTSETLDPLSAVTTGAGPSPGTGWKFTVPTGHDGLYLVSSTVVIETATGIAYLSVYKNANQVALLGGATAAANRFILAGSHLVQLAAGDYIQIVAHQITGGSRNTSGWGPDTNVSILRVLADI